MTEELYNELVNSGFITDTSLTLDAINKTNIELRDLVTQPSVYNYFSNKYNVVETDDPIIIDDDSIIVVGEEVDDVTDVEVVEVDETPEMEPVVDTVEIETESTPIDEIVVDETEVDE